MKKIPIMKEKEKKIFGFCGFKGYRNEVLHSETVLLRYY